MHEMSVAQSLIDILKEEMEKHRAKELKSVHLHIGELSTVVPDALSFCFRVLVGGTALSGAELITKVVPLRGYCPLCKLEFEIKNYTFLCPSCSNTKIDTIAGQDLTIVEMEVH